MSVFLVDYSIAEFVKAKPGQVRKVIERGIAWSRKNELPIDKKNLANLGIHDATHAIASKKFGDRAKVVLPPSNKAFDDFVNENNLGLKDILRAKNNHSYKYRANLMSTPENTLQNVKAEDLVDGLQGLKFTVNSTGNPTREYWLGRRYRKKVKNNPELNLIKKVQAYQYTEPDSYLDVVGKISAKDPVRRYDTLPYTIK